MLNGAFALYVSTYKFLIYSLGYFCFQAKENRYLTKKGQREKNKLKEGEKERGGGEKAKTWISNELSTQWMNEWNENEN